jgi:hypothetical protein
VKNDDHDDLARRLLDTPPGRRTDMTPRTGPMPIAQILASKDSKLRPMMERVQELGRVSLDGDLAWMDYHSWFRSGNEFQRRVRDLLNPLFWGAVFFELSAFRSKAKEIVTALPRTAKGTLYGREDQAQVLITDESRKEWGTSARPLTDGGKSGWVISTFTYKGVTEKKEKK